jgi:hypothetical protein
MPDPAQLLLFVAIGGLLGALGGLFGIGGGVIAIPVLVIAFHLDQQHAQGTSLVMVAPTVMLGLRGYARRGSLDRRTSRGPGCATDSPLSPARWRSTSRTARCARATLQRTTRLPARGCRGAGRRWSA